MGFLQELKGKSLDTNREAFLSGIYLVTWHLSAHVKSDSSISDPMLLGMMHVLNLK
jgi:hypothetical protein